MASDTVILKAAGVVGDLRVGYDAPEGERQERVFSEDFFIGRDETCDLVLASDVVSKRHIKVYRRDDGWWVRDLGSVNGTFLNGERIQHARISRDSDLQVAVDGPVIRVEPVDKQPSAQARDEEPTVIEPPRGGEAPPVPGPAPLREHRPETVPDLSSDPPAPPPLAPAPPTEAPAASLPPGSVTQVLERYADDKPPANAGPNTLIMRRAFARVRRRVSRRYKILIAAVGGLLLATIGIVCFQQRKLAQLTALGVELFYDMKEMEVQVERLLQAGAQTGDAGSPDELAAKRKQLDAMQERYDAYVQETGLLDRYPAEEDRLVFRIARLFGECELALPENFLSEVKRYIGLWKGSRRLQEAVARVVEGDLAAKVSGIMLADHLPPQFLYLGLQESDFKPDAVGHKTRFGIAKGVWQFIPDTAAQFGLRTGPLVELPVYDPRDERFDFEKATRAAANYLRYIYNTEAQASGLLVIASYNWGHNAIRRRIRQMPDNPRERNFWRLLAQQDIPRQTYDYVFYIVSAAVIGENPKLFGFDFDNPLEGGQ